MATGIKKRHSKGCPGGDGGRCRCNAGWEASVYSKRDSKKIRKVFAREAEAKSWRADALSALAKGGLRAPKPTTIRQAWEEWQEGAVEGTIVTARAIPSSPPRSAPMRARCAERSFPSSGASGSRSFAAAICRPSPIVCSFEG
jgi:hypothetical protein